MGKPEESEPVRLIREAANDLDPPAPAETGGLKQKDNPESLPHFSEVDLRRVEGVGATGNPLYRLNKPLIWWGNITIPAGFMTDLASGPVRSDDYTPAYIIHDHLCQKARKKLTVDWQGRKKLFTMKMADDTFYDALLDAGCPKLKAWTYWAYVRARHIALGEG